MADKFQLKAIISAVDKLSPTLKGMALQAKITRKALGDISSGGGQLFRTMGISGAAALAGFWASVKKVVGVSSEFERFETILSTVEGSSEKAKKSMDWVTEFAKRTPYELTEVMDSFVKLRAYGIDPTSGAMSAVGDAAAAMGKPVMQAVEALADAMTGENERLKEFGIRASKAGDTITYTWSENGKTMAAQAKASSREQIEAVLSGIWNRRYGGAMDKLSGTWDGMYSNMLDAATSFVKKIGAGGFFDAIKTQLKGILTQFNQMQDSGALDNLAQQISNDLTAVLQDLVTWVKSVDWEKFYRGVKQTISDVRDFVSSIGGLKTILIALAVVMLAGPVAAIFQIIGALWTLSKTVISSIGIFAKFAMANPVLLGIMLAVMAIAGVVYLVYKNWEPLKEFFLKQLEWIKSFIADTWESFKTVLSWSPLGLILRAWGPVVEFFGGLWDKVQGITGAVPSQTSAQNPLGAGGTTKFPGLNNKTQLNGEMVVKFENAPAGMRVNPGKTNQTGVGLNPDVGYRPLSVFAM